MSTYAAPLSPAGAERAGPESGPQSPGPRPAERRGLRPSQVPVGHADRLERPSRRPAIQRCGLNSTCGCPAHEKLEGAQRDLGRATATGGAPLPSGARERMEQAFSTDFGGVRIHTGGDASSAADALEARAVTTGSDILFGAGEFAPGTTHGDHLLAHELAHVVQQSQGLARQPIDGGPADGLETAARSTADRVSSRASPSAEREADGAAGVAATGGSVAGLSRQPRSIARQPKDAGAPPPVPTVTITKSAEPVAVRTNATDFNNNVHAKFGDEGGKTEVTGSVSWQTLDGKVTTVSSSWVVKESYPSVLVAPGSTLPATELAACQSLASRLEQHEDAHAAIEKPRRDKFLTSIVGLSDADANKKLDTLECEIGAAQRTLDCKEGKITLDGSNKLDVSGIDHPEYIPANCPPSFKAGGCAAPAAPPAPAKKP